MCLKPNFNHHKQSSIIKIITAIFPLLQAPFSISEVVLEEKIFMRILQEQIDYEISSWIKQLPGAYLRLLSTDC